MELYELELKQLLEIKLLRLNKPKFQNTTSPFFGMYNSIDSLAEINTNTTFENKFSELLIPDENSINVENMFTISNYFGRVLYCESLEALLILNNLSQEEIKIKEIKVKITNEVLQNSEFLYKKSEFTLINIGTPFTILAKGFNTQKIKFTADIMCKYNIEIEIQYSSKSFNDEYLRNTGTKIVKTISSNYYIENNNTNVVRKFFKKFLFDTNLPFKIKDRFINNSAEKAIIEINVLNQSPYNLHLKELTLTTNDNSVTIQPIVNFNNTNIEIDEELNIMYMFEDYSTFLNYVIFYFYVE